MGPTSIDLMRQGQRSRNLALRWFRSRGAAVSRTYSLRVLGVHPGGRTGYRLACRWEHEPNVVQCWMWRWVGSHKTRNPQLSPGASVRPALWRIP